MPVVINLPYKIKIPNIFNIYVAFSIFLLWFAAIFDPIGMVFGLRYIALINICLCIILIFIFSDLRHIPFNFRFFSIFFLSIVCPIYGLLIFIIRGGWHGSFIDTSYISSAVLITTSLIYINKEFVNLGIKSMLNSLQILCLVIIAIQINLIFSLNDSWLSFFTERSVALISFREYAGLTLPYIYFLASPLLIFLVAHRINNLFMKVNTINLINAAFAITALFISGTRSHMIIAVISLPLIFFLTKVKRKFEISILVAILFILLLLYFDSEILRSMFSLSETNNAFKFSMLNNYSHIFNDLFSLFFGQGFNAHEWSTPLMKMISFNMGASKTELTYIEFIRVYGLFISIPFFYILIYPIKKLMKLKKEFIWLYPAYILYLINASLNPYLFSTNGMLSLGLIISVISMKDFYIKT